MGYPFFPENFWIFGGEKREERSQKIIES